MANYLSAAKRHLVSGDLLEAAGQLAESSHLWAYGAECALKALIEMHVAPISGSQKAHINEYLSKPKKADLVGCYNATIAGHLAAPLPAAMFINWTIDERYEDGSAILPHHASHKADRQAIGAVLTQAGLLP